MKNKITPTFSIVNSLAVIALSSGIAHASSIIDNFESEIAGGSISSDWSSITVAGTPIFQVTAAGAGSNGLGGNAGLGIQVSSTDFLNPELPGAYLVNNTAFDLTSSFAGTFDFLIANEGTADDITFTFGDIGAGLSTSSAGGHLTTKILENVDTGIANGTGTVLAENGAPSLGDDTWYRASVNWDITSGLTGNYSMTVTNLTSGTEVSSVGVTDFTFDNANAKIGFGSVNDTLILDNVNIASVPEPSSIALLGLGSISVLLRCRR